MRYLRSEPLAALASVRLTIVLLIAFATLGIMGTVIPQEEPAEAIGFHRLLYHLQLYDIFHSFIFYFLTGLLTLNLVLCSLSRFPQAWKRFRGETETVKFKREEVIVSSLEADEVAERILSILRKRRYKIYPSSEKNVLKGKAGLISHLGTYIVHLGVLILILGALLSSVFGVDGYVNVREGETVDRIGVDKRGHRTYELPFQIRLEKFMAEFYENGMPKQYRSDLEILKDGKRLMNAPILVNHPLDIEGFRIYQASYGELPGGRARISIFHGEKKLGDLTIQEGSEAPLPGEEQARISALRVENNFMRMGPAVKLLIKSPRGEFAFWVFKNIEKIVATNPGILEEVKMINPRIYTPYNFVLQELWSTYYSGLQVKYDPGAPFVGIAAFIIVIGLIINYFISPRTLTISWEKREEGTLVRAKGTATRDSAILKRDLSLLKGELGK